MGRLRTRGAPAPRSRALGLWPARRRSTPALRPRAARRSQHLGQSSTCLRSGGQPPVRAAGAQMRLLHKLLLLLSAAAAAPASHGSPAVARPHGSSAVARPQPSSSARPPQQHLRGRRLATDDESEEDREELDHRVRRGESKTACKRSWADPAGIKSPWSIPLYFLGVCWCFAGIAHVAERYFAVAIQRMVEAWDLPPAVAGATLMAAGSSAPATAGGRSQTSTCAGWPPRSTAPRRARCPRSTSRPPKSTGECSMAT